jgi:hypothetical protein
LKNFALFSVISGSFAAFTVAAALATGAVSAPQSIPDGELQRFIYNTQFPIACGKAQQASAKLRSRPSTAPADMHAAMEAYKECFQSPTARNQAGLQNTSIYAYSAAALMAARHEPPPQSLTDAQMAAKGCGYVAGFTHETPYNIRISDNSPSVYRTNCSRIYQDAKTLAAAIQSASSSSPAAMPAASSPAH